MRMASHRHVFINPALAAETYLTERTFHSPTPYPGNPLVFDGDYCDREKLAPAAEVETADDDQHAYVSGAEIVEGTHRWLHPSIFGRLGQINSVVRSPITGKLQMYYLVIGGLNLIEGGNTGGAFPTCYAESDDGINWHMPALNRFKVWGSTQNNVMFAPPSSAYVKVDPHQPDPSKRYIAFVHHGPRIYTSPDGINWSKPIAAKLQTALGRSDGDTFLGYDPAIAKYVAYFRPWKEYATEPADRQLFRRIGRAVSDDLEHWKNHECVLSADEGDGPTAQLERMLVFPYQGAYLGLAHVMRNFTEERRTYSYMVGSIYNELCFSHDNRQWHRFDERHPFISATGGVRSRGMVLSADAPVEMGDELFFYYSQSHHLHGHLPNYENFSVAKLLKDRFSGFRAGAEEGYVLTQPIACPGGTLHVNADTQRGDMRVGIIMEDGQHSVEHAAFRCNYVFGQANTHAIRWDRTSDVDSLRGKTIRLKLYLRDAELFSFWFE